MVRREVDEPIEGTQVDGGSDRVAYLCVCLFSVENPKMQEMGCTDPDLSCSNLQ